MSRLKRKPADAPATDMPTCRIRTTFVSLLTWVWTVDGLSNGRQVSGFALTKRSAIKKATAAAKEPHAS